MDVYDIIKHMRVKMTGMRSLNSANSIKTWTRLEYYKLYGHAQDGNGRGLYLG